MQTLTQNRSLAPLLLAAIALAGFDSSGAAGTQAVVCDIVTAVEGDYECAGECVVTNPDGTRRLIPVSGEKGTVQRFPGSTMGIYKVSIDGAHDFRELEIGTLVGLTMRTATAEVTGGQFPVLEEYVFDTAPDCTARGFTKAVRNPSQDQFKACVVRCDKLGV